MKFMFQVYLFEWVVSFFVMVDYVVEFEVWFCGELFLQNVGYVFEFGFKVFFVEWGWDDDCCCIEVWYDIVKVFGEVVKVGFVLVYCDFVVLIFIISFYYKWYGLFELVVIGGLVMLFDQVLVVMWSLFDQVCVLVIRQLMDLLVYMRGRGLWLLL